MRVLLPAETMWGMILHEGILACRDNVGGGMILHEGTLACRGNVGDDPS